MLRSCFRSQDTTAAGVKITSRTCLIMDEVDGMSAGDRGGVGALNGLIKNTKVAREVPHPALCKHTLINISTYQ
jgi:hypothetical protein